MFKRLMESPLGAGLTRAQQAEHQQSIMDRCNKVVAILGERHASAEISRLQSVKTEIRAQSIEDSLARIDELYVLSKACGFKRPVDEIQHLQSLMSSCETHIELLKADSGPADDVKKMQVLITEAHARIDVLQPSRTSIEEIPYSYGAKAALIRLYDGYRQGKSEFWYEDGTPRLTAEYAQDMAEGEVYVYAPSGAQVASGVLQKVRGYAEWTLQLAPEKVFMTMSLNKDKGELNVWLWNGVYVGRAPMRAKRFQRLGFCIRLLFKPRVWTSFWQVRKLGPARDELDRMKSCMAIWTAAQKEVLGDLNVTRSSLILQTSAA
jgi:hypothetical protein